MLNLNRLAIIPARAGSKRIKNKNLIDFNGKPIIEYTIDNAKKSKLFDSFFFDVCNNCNTPQLNKTEQIKKGWLPKMS